MKARTQVGIIGAGPAGLLLCHLLRLRGIDSVVLEDRSRQYVEERVRAGVLEHGAVETLREAGLADRLDREGLRHAGIAIRFNGRSHRIDFTELTGKAVTVYGQQEVVKDLITAALVAGTPIEFDVKHVSIHGIGDDAPSIHYRDAQGNAHELECDFIAGCDGFHGISRPSFPAGVIRTFERDYPFAWLGILAQSPPPSHELIYVHHDRGFALFSMRTPQVTRMYLQCAPDEDIAHWPDERIWAELRRRLEGGPGGENAPTLIDGPILQKGITPMRSFVAEPMRHGRLFLAGDSAHIVPPTGAKGMNLAIADVRVLARALDAFYQLRDPALLDRYSGTCLRRVWKAERFSWWMTSLLHRFHAQSPFDYRVQVADLDYLTGSRAASTALAENYVGLPFGDG